MLRDRIVVRRAAWQALLILLGSCGWFCDSTPQAAAAPPGDQREVNSPPSSPKGATSIGVNLAGAEFGRLDGKFGSAYIYPGAKSFDYFKSKGMTVIRLPFRWERLQPVLMQPLEAEELSRLDFVVKLARERGMTLLLDVHNYARYRGHLIGAPEVPNAAFADLWRRLAEHYRNEPAIFAYGIMNEPHGTKGLWPAAAQAAVDAIRSVDMQHTITVCGDGFSGAHSWLKFNGELLLNDPADNLLYEAHQYFDRDNSGTYKRPYDVDGATPDVGVKRLQPFITWLEKHHVRGFIGEFGVPAYDPRWLVVLDRFLAEMKKHDLGGTYWAAGPWWGSSPLSVEPIDGKERPQMEVLAWYAGHRTRPADAAVDMSYVPPASTPGAYIFGLSNAPYTYKNDASEVRQSIVAEHKHAVRKISYKHAGEPAWVGASIYYGKLDCKNFDAFELTVRADRPCKLQISAFHPGDERYNASVEVTSDWQTLVIPFAKLTGKEGAAFDAARPLEKVSFQPEVDRSPQGNSLYFDLFRPR